MSDDTLKELEGLKTKLKEKGVGVDHLYILYLGNLEQIIGKSVTNPTPGNVCTVEDPKRIIRVTQVQGNGISISMMVGDLDLLEGGKVEMIPQLVYRIVDQPDDSQMAIFTMYAEYLNKKIIGRAEAVGIVLPGRTSPFKRG